MAFIGLVISHVSSQLELDGDSPVGSLSTTFLGAQRRVERSLTASNAGLFATNDRFRLNRPAFSSHFGLGLMLIGLCGGVYYQL
jgi:hypothetical protein